LIGPATTEGAHVPRYRRRNGEESFREERYPDVAVESELLDGARTLCHLQAPVANGPQTIERNEVLPGTNREVTMRLPLQIGVEDGRCRVVTVVLACDGELYHVRELGFIDVATKPNARRPDVGYCLRVFVGFIEGVYLIPDEDSALYVQRERVAGGHRKALTRRAFDLERRLRCFFALNVGHAGRWGCRRQNLCRNRYWGATRGGRTFPKRWLRPWATVGIGLIGGRLQQHGG